MIAPATTVTLRLRLTTTAERHVRGGHPWVYSDSVTEQNREGDIGDLAVIYDKKDKFLALGLYDPTSPIRVRVLHAGKPARATPQWWQERLLKAKTIRLAHFDDDTTGFRWISGESDGFPGLVLDRYAKVLVLKLYSAIWLPMLPNLVDWILTEFSASALVLRLSRNIQEIARSHWGVSEGCLHGHTENLVVFRENGIAFEAEVIQGQKTGFYLDQRDRPGQGGTTRRRPGCVECLQLFRWLLPLRRAWWCAERDRPGHQQACAGERPAELCSE